MTTSHGFAAALAAVALAACAHANTNTSSVSAPSYLGGRAGQPGSWIQSAESTRVERARRQAWNDPQLGGRSAQPGSWIRSDTPVPASAAPSYCYAGGRDAQPFSGPSSIWNTPASSESAPLCERTSAQTGTL